MKDKLRETNEEYFRRIDREAQAAQDKANEAKRNPLFAEELARLGLEAK